MKGEVHYKMLCTEVITVESPCSLSPDLPRRKKDVVIVINIWCVRQTQYEYEAQKKSPFLTTLVSTEVKH